MIILPDWLEDRRVKSFLISLDAYPVKQFHWECKNEPPIEIERLITDEQLDLILKNGVPVIGGKVQVFYIKDQYLPNYHLSKSSPFKLHLTKCGSVKAGDSRGKNSYVLTRKIGDYYKINLKNSFGRVYSTDADVKMTVCLNCLKTITKPPINFTKPEQYSSFTSWAQDFDISSFLEHQNTKAYNSLKSDLTTNKYTREVDFVSDVKCSNCNSQYAPQLRETFKHLSVNNGPCLCYNCYTERYPDLFKYISQNHFKIARVKLKKSQKVDKEINPVHNMDKTILRTVPSSSKTKDLAVITPETLCNNHPSNSVNDTKSRIIIAQKTGSEEKYIYSLKLPNKGDFESLRRLVNSVKEKDDTFYHIKLYTSEFRNLKSASINDELEIYGVNITIQDVLYLD